MSEAACKTILCSGGARASVLTYSIVHEADATTELKLAVNRAVWELQTAVEVTHLLIEQKFKISRQDVYPMVEAMDTLEYQLKPEMPLADAITMMNVESQNIHEGILYLHKAVTGEDANYQIH